MLTIIFTTLVIYWIVQVIIIDDFFWAILITCIIMFLFVNIDFEKETVELKTKIEIKQSIDEAHDAAIGAIEKAGEVSVDVGKAFDKGQENVRETESANTVEDTGKVDLDSFEWPAIGYVDLSLRSSEYAALFSSNGKVSACMLDGSGCFSNYLLKVHSDRTRYICKGEEVCYRAE